MVSQGLDNEKRDAYCDHVQKMFDEVPMYEFMEPRLNTLYFGRRSCLRLSLFCSVEVCE